MAGLMLQPERRWECPACGKQDVTRIGEMHTQMHVCGARHGLMFPMLPAGTSAKVDVVVREDYVGSENVQYSDDGRPIMSVVITRDDGQDCVIFAPSASANGEA